MKEPHRSLLAELRKNSRVKVVHLSQCTDTPDSTVADYLKKLDPVIIRHVSLFNSKLIGFPFHMFMAAKTKNDALKKFLLKNSHTNNVHRTTSCYFFDAYFQDMQEVNEFTDQLESLHIKVKMFYVTSTILKEEFCSFSDE